MEYTLREVKDEAGGGGSCSAAVGHNTYLYTAGFFKNIRVRNRLVYRRTYVA